MQVLQNMFLVKIKFLKKGKSRRPHVGVLIALLINIARVSTGILL